MAAKTGLSSLRPMDGNRGHYRLHFVFRSLLYTNNLYFPVSCFSVRYAPSPMDPTMVSNHWDLEQGIVECLPQLGGDHTITKRTCSFCVINNLRLNAYL